VIVRHQRASASNKGFRQLARYIRGRSDKPRATWFLAVNLPGVTGTRNLELACRLVEAVNAQNTRAGSNRTYHLVVSLHPEDRSLDGNELRRVVENLVETLGFAGHQYIAARHNDKDHEHVHVAINKIHPETFRMHSPAWDHQKLFTAGRVLELELGLTPLQSRVRDREKVPQRAADHEAHHGIDSFARWARKRLGPALQAGELRSWGDLHEVCASLGVVLRQPAPGHQLEAARTATLRYSPVPAIAPQDLWKEYEQSLGRARLERERSWSGYRHAATDERRRLKGKYRRQRAFIAALPISGADKRHLSQQLSLRQGIDSRALKHQLTRQRKAIQKTMHPGTWRHFVASRARDGDARAIRLLHRRARSRDRSDQEREL
jgi:hypothetical protein